jgi:hypothetical protein
MKNHVELYRVGRSIMDYFLRVRHRRRWGLWAERLAKSARQQPKLLRKYSGGDERTRCCSGVCLPPRHHSELCAELKTEKLLNVGGGPDATAKRRKEQMRAEWAADLADLRRWRPVFAGERVNADISQELLRQNVVPWVQRDVAWWKIRPSADSAPAYAA